MLNYLKKSAGDVGEAIYSNELRVIKLILPSKRNINIEIKNLFYSIFNSLSVRIKRYLHFIDQHKITIYNKLIFNSTLSD